MTRSDSHAPTKPVHEFTGHDALNLHLLSAHCNGAALGLTPEEAADQHHHEHYGPGGIRNHPFESRHFDPVKASAVIDECADMMGDDLASGVRELLRHPTQVTRTNMASHTHRPATQVRPSPAVCTVRACEAYPRWVDVTVERDADGVFLSADSTRLDHRADLISHHLSEARKFTEQARDRIAGGPGFAASYYLDRIHERLAVLADLTRTNPGKDTTP